MAEMTLQQQQAIAMANARLRLQQQGGAQPAQAPALPAVPSTPADVPASAIQVPTPWGGMFSPVTAGQTVKNLGLEGGGATLGQIAGAPLAEFGGVQALGAVGGALGNVAGQLTTPGKPFSWGDVTAAGIAGSIPGASLAKAGVKTVAQQAGKYALTNLAAQNAKSLIDTGAPSSLGEDALAATGGALAAPLAKYLDAGAQKLATATAASEGAPMRAVLQDAKDLKMAIPPVVSNPTLANKAAHVIGGGSDVINAAREINAPAAVQAVRDELGFKPGQPMSLESLNSKAVGTNLVYDKIAQASPEAALALSQFKDYTAQANKAFSAYNGSQIKLPAQLDAAKALQANADAAADLLKGELKNQKASALWDEFQNSRKLRAQIELAKEAISPSGKIDASVFGKAYENGRPLTGNFAKLGRVESEFSKYVASQPQTPSGNIFGGVTKLGAGALLGYGAGGIPGAAIGALTVPPLVRKSILSGVGQRAFATPFYGAATEDVPASVVRLGTMSGTRN